MAGLHELGARMQRDGITSAMGLREHDSWRYVMIEAPDGILLELFEFDDAAAVVNRTGRL
ncbi:MAG: hypothetical protein ACKVP7_01750 [Hyphomicrobiaceae bacterium]